MEFSTRFFPEILLDNDVIYFEHLKGVIESVDEYSSLEIAKINDSYHFRLAPSHPKYSQPLLREVLKFHNMCNIRLQLSKSIRTSNTISFEINEIPTETDRISKRGF